MSTKLGTLSNGLTVTRFAGPNGKPYLQITGSSSSLRLTAIVQVPEEELRTLIAAELEAEVQLRISEREAQIDIAKRAVERERALRDENTRLQEAALVVVARCTKVERGRGWCCIDCGKMRHSTAEEWAAGAAMHSHHDGCKVAALLALLPASDNATLCNPAGSKP